MSTSFVLRGTPTSSTPLLTLHLLIEFVCLDSSVFSEPLRLRLHNVVDGRGQASFGEYSSVCKAAGAPSARIRGADNVLIILSFNDTLDGALSSEKLIVGQSYTLVSGRQSLACRCACARVDFTSSICRRLCCTNCDQESFEEALVFSFKRHACGCS